MHGHGQYKVSANMTAESCSLASRSVTKAIVTYVFLLWKYRGIPQAFVYL